MNEPGMKVEPAPPLEAAEKPARSNPGLSPALTVAIEASLLGCLWLLMFPVRRAAVPEVYWDRHLALALGPAVIWVMLVGRRAPGWWLQRGGPVRVLASRLWPIAAVATAPALPAMFSSTFELAAIPVLFLYGLVAAVFLVLTALGLGLRASGEPRRADPSSTLAERFLAIGGICCALSLSGFDRSAGMDRPWLQWFLELLGEGLRWCGVIGISAFLTARADHFPRFGFGLYARYRSWSGRGVLLVCCALSVLFSGLFAAFALDRVPHLQDEIAMIFQAKNLAAGRLFAPAPALPDFFDMEFVVMDGDRWYGKYQLGPSVWYLPGVLLNCVWLVSPAFSVAAMVLLYLLAREILGTGWGKGAVLLALISPWWMLTFSSMMAHPGCLLVLSGFALFFVRSAKRPGRWLDAAFAGIFLGLAIHFRPYTALLIAAVMVIGALAAGWWRNLRAAGAAAFLLPVLGSLVLMLAYNHALTGDAQVSPFEKWSGYDRLGFGPDRGMYDGKLLGFTPADGLDNLRLQLKALGASFMGWPAATLLIPMLALAAGGLKGRCRLLAMAPVVLIGGYFFYHYGWPIFYGVRYWSEALPAMLLLTLVGLEIIRRAYRGGLRLAGVRAASARSRAFAVWMLVLLVAGNAVGYMPGEIRDYREGVWWASCSAAQDAVRDREMKNALVFMDTPHYRKNKYSLDWYGSGFQANSPDLDDDVLFVRDLGDGENRKLMELYPERDCFRMSRYGPRLATLTPYSAEDASAVPEARPAPQP